MNNFVILKKKNKMNLLTRSFNLKLIVKIIKNSYFTIKWKSFDYLIFLRNIFKEQNPVYSDKGK